MIIPQTSVHSSGKDEPLPADLKAEVTAMVTVPNGGTSETTGTAE